MRRRAFLASAGIAALAGCSGDGSTTATPTRTATGTGTFTDSGNAEFEFVGAEAAESVSINVSTTFGLGVRNVGSGPGTFTATLETRLNDGEWRQNGEIEIPLSAGETGEWHSPQFSLQYLGTYQFRLSAFDETWSIEATPRRLDFDNRYAAPTGLFVNVLGGSFETTYPTTDDGAATAESTPAPRTPAPDEGDVWAVMRIDVRNRLEEPQSTPDPSEFVLEVDGERRPQHQAVSDDPYDGGELGGRTVERGDLVYAVPEGTSASDISLRWESSLPGGDVEVIWTN
jgi:hypothetical protein